MKEQDLIDIGFIKLQAATLIYLYVFRDEIVEICAARRLLNTDGQPLSGYMFEGLAWVEYIEDIEKLKKLLFL